MNSEWPKRPRIIIYNDRNCQDKSGSSNAGSQIHNRFFLLEPGQGVEYSYHEDQRSETLYDFANTYTSAECVSYRLIYPNLMQVQIGPGGNVLFMILSGTLRIPRRSTRDPIDLFNSMPHQPFLTLSFRRSSYSVTRAIFWTVLMSISLASKLNLSKYVSSKP